MTGNDGQYSTVTGSIYVFNLIVGTGALALPIAFAQAGWFLGLVMVCVLGLVSFITVTFIFEALAVANAVHRKMKEEDPDDEDALLVRSSEDQCFDMTKKFEIDEMATLFLSKPSKVLVSLCLISYLIGDLSIYSAAVARTLSHVTCTYRPGNASCNETLPDESLCWDGYGISRNAAYRIFVCVFALAIGPFVFFDLKKTKFLQFATSCMRWIAFAIMISWAIQKLVVDGRQGFPPVANVYSLPTLFGASVYSFMCQHSIPGLVQPVADKLRLKKTFFYDYVLISLFYLLLSLTAAFTFKEVESLYTLNFWSDSCENEEPAAVMFFGYFLALFPVFTLSTSFPIIAITLKNNLRNIVRRERSNRNYFLENVLLPVIVIALPCGLAIAVSDLKMLVGIIGSYAGAGVQYLIPCLLVSAARSRSTQFLTPNPYLSPFSSTLWVLAVYFWMGLSLLLISIKYLGNLF